MAVEDTGRAYGVIEISFKYKGKRNLFKLLGEADYEISHKMISDTEFREVDVESSLLIVACYLEVDMEAEDIKEVVDDMDYQFSDEIGDLDMEVVGIAFSGEASSKPVTAEVGRDGDEPVLSEVNIVFSDVVTPSGFIGLMEFVETDVNCIVATLTWEEFKHVSSVSQAMIELDKGATVSLPVGVVDAFEDKVGGEEVNISFSNLVLHSMLPGFVDPTETRRISLSGSEKHGCDFEVGCDNWLTLDDLEQAFLTGKLPDKYEAVSLLRKD